MASISFFFIRFSSLSLQKNTRPVENAPLLKCAPTIIGRVIFANLIAVMFYAIISSTGRIGMLNLGTLYRERQSYPMADSFFDGCYDPKRPSPDQLYPLLYKTSAAAEIILCQLHFYGTNRPTSIFASRPCNLQL